MSFAPEITSQQTIGLKDTRRIFAKPKGFETFVQRQARRDVQCQSARTQMSRKEQSVVDKENHRSCTPTNAGGKKV